MKRAIVTGANGFLGRYLVNALSISGYEVYAVVRSRGADIQSIFGIPNVIPIYCDLQEIELLPQKISANVAGSTFYHLAWSGSSGNARSNYELQLKNAIFSVKAAEIAAQMKCRRIVYTGSVTQLMYRDYLRNDEIFPERITCYAVGKMASEAMVKCICPSLDIEWCWAYIANFYGADDPTENFINFLIKSYRQGTTPDLTPATQLADFMYVTDVAKAILALGELGKANSAYYVGYGEPKALSYFIKAIHKQISPNTETGIGRKTFQGLGIDYSKIDYQKLFRDTGFLPEVSFEQGIQRILEQGK